MTNDPLILLGRRAFPEAQAQLAGIPIVQAVGAEDVGWYDTAIDPETGSFAVVSEADPSAADLIGETIRVEYGARFVYAYVIGARDVSTRVALARRAFLGLAPPSAGTIEGYVKVVAR